ncbi:hypothetical protein [Acidaminobacterium chupaoyuni]
MMLYALNAASPARSPSNPAVIVPFIAAIVSENKSGIKRTNQKHISKEICFFHAQKPFLGVFGHPVGCRGMIPSARAVEKARRSCKKQIFMADIA